MSKVKIISEYRYDFFCNDLADELNEKIEDWTNNNNVEIINVSTSLNNVKDNDGQFKIVMTANIIYK